MKKLKIFMNTFCMITTGTTIATASFCACNAPGEMLSPMSLWEILAVSSATALTTLIYPMDRGMGKVEMIVRIVLQYLAVNAIVLGAGHCIGWYHIDRASSLIPMLLVIAVIFGAVSGVSWTRSAQEAKRMNELLREYQEKEKEKEKNPVDKSDTHEYNESVCE